MLRLGVLGARVRLTLGRVLVLQVCEAFDGMAQCCVHLWLQRGGGTLADAGHAVLGKQAGGEAQAVDLGAYGV